MGDFNTFWQVQDSVFLRTVNPASDPEALYLPAGLETLLARLMLFCSSVQALVSVSGAAGTGKSTLLKWLFHKLPQDTHDVLLTTMVQKETAGGWLMPRLAELFGAPLTADGTVAQTIRHVAARLDELHAAGRKLIVVVDAAHLATTPEALSEVAALLNLQTLAGTCLSVVLAGDPGFDAMLAATPSLNAKVAFHLNLPPLSEAETTAYVEHRLRQAGLASPFDAEALALIYRRSRGVMSAVNAYAENCLVEAYQRGVRRVTAEVAKAAALHLRPLTTAGSADTESPLPPLPFADQQLTESGMPPPAPPARARDKQDAAAKDKDKDRAEAGRGRQPDSDQAANHAEPVAIKLASLFKSESGGRQKP